ncbi:MAG: outer membrane protein assembly factor BamE [Proteobacteria bacterium]|nr:outer membrane protein assembly factor BamE [Pseudomonadota bacterium]
MPLRTRFFVTTLAIALALGQSACSPRVATRGATPDADKIAEIKAGVSSRADVERLIGSPSSINAFGEETWMYIGETTETLAFFEPKVSERQVLSIAFDDNGLVKQVSAHGLDIARDIEPVGRQTPTVGKKMTVIEQIVGNLNRYKSLGTKNKPAPQQ